MPVRPRELLVLPQQVLHWLYLFRMERYELPIIVGKAKEALKFLLVAGWHLQQRGLIPSAETTRTKYFASVCVKSHSGAFLGAF